MEINLFGVFDGHGGNKCSNFLKDHLFNNLLNHKEFGKNIEKSVRETFASSDEYYLKSVDNSNYMAVDRSGSCSLVCMMMGRK